MEENELGGKSGGQCDSQRQLFNCPVENLVINPQSCGKQCFYLLFLTFYTLFRAL